jgi:HlyD family secretion protein
MMQRLISLSLLFAGLISMPAMALDIPAVLQYARVVELGVPVSGVVSKVQVEEGDRVAKGDLLLELEDIPFLAEVDRTEADLRWQSARLEEKRKEHERNEELYDRMVLSTVELDSSRVALARVESDWKNARSAHTLAKYHYEKSRLHAPFDGVVFSRSVNPGQSIRVDLQPQVMVKIADTTSYVAETEVTAERIGSFATGLEVQVSIDDKSYAAIVQDSTLIAAGTTLAQPSRYRVRVKLLEADAGFRPGRQAVIVLPDAG